MLIDAAKINLLKIKSNNLLRERISIVDHQGIKITVNRKLLVNFSSNDYLGLSTHHEVKKAFIDGAQQFGLGSGASALVSGYYKPHHLLEDKFAEFLNRDKAILFSSGYLANLGVFTTFADRKSTVIADKFCHASILDGIQLSRAKHDRYKHNDVEHMNSLLRASNNKVLIVTESVFSMAGDFSPIVKLANITKQYKASLIIDDAHGVGVLGKHGGGICDSQSLSQDDVTCLVTPLGKAFGSMGAIVSGNSVLIDEITQSARMYRYTTALPPAIAHATLTSLKILQTEDWRRLKLNTLIEYFILQAKNRNLPLISDDMTPIKSILIGDNSAALKIKNYLARQGFFISCIRPPTVPAGTARIRISLCCMHEEEDITQLLDLLAEAYALFARQS